MANCPNCGMEISKGNGSSVLKILVVLLIIIFSTFTGLLSFYFWSGGTLFYEYSPMNVHIITDGSWNGTISDWDGLREISGYGYENCNVVGGRVTATIWGNSSTESLVVQIIRGHDGKILEEGSTNISYGVVTVHYEH